MQAHHVAIHQLAVFPTQLQAVVTRIDHQALVATPILGELVDGDVVRLHACLDLSLLHGKLY